MFEWHMEDDVIMLLKTLKKEYLNSTLDGTLCFSCPDVFTSENNTLKPGQHDPHDSAVSIIAHHLVFAPIISEQNGQIVYGKGVLAADKAQLWYRSNASLYSPINCFRKVTPSDLRQRDGRQIYALGDLVDKIQNDMGHDAYILIYAPLEFLQRVNEKEFFFAHSVFYGEKDATFEHFIAQTPNQQGTMFQKSLGYAWQNEYRLVLSPRANTQQVFMNIGSIRDIALGGDLEDLRKGLAFWHREEEET